jgi:hypothetical protein
MITSEHKKARLFISYFKDKTELFLYKKATGTNGSHCIYRRSPGDAAMHLRINSLLEISGLLRSEIEIWIMLYPPEIHTTTFYVSSNVPDSKISNSIHEQILSSNPYFIHYDWKNFILERRENGHGKDMVTVTFVGRQVLPRIRSLLYKDMGKVNFIGDGLQFLSVDERQIPDIRGLSYEIVLPYGESYYRAMFRSGIHFESICHVKHNWSPAAFGKMDPEQVYLKYELRDTRMDVPMILPLVLKSEWKEALLTPAAFPLWFIAGKTMYAKPNANFADVFHRIGIEKDSHKIAIMRDFDSKYEA